MNKDSFERLGLNRQALTVSQLNNQARLLLEDVFAQVWVEGEISNLAKPASGHVYFTLKDANAQVRCALFRQNALKVRQVLRDGLAIKVRGRVSLFEGRGDFQLIADAVEAAGDGALRLAFEALKQTLTGEGLFDQARKQALPTHPKRIGIISSPTGAVIRDIISVFKRRAPQVELTLIPTPVQGREATQQIVKALTLADAQGFDALILARGGGSLEDLWCFNEEAVARAVAACQTPIVSAIGHETDVSISDFVADVRAPTPSAAAELLAPDMGDLSLRLSSLNRRLSLSMRSLLRQHRAQLDGLSRRLRHPREKLQQQTLRVDDLAQRLQRALERRLSDAKARSSQLTSRLNAQHPGRAVQHYQQQLGALEAQLNRAMRTHLARKTQHLALLGQTLHAVSPLATLNRGYSILLNENGQAVNRLSQAQPGQRLEARLSDGSLSVEVKALSHP